MSAPTRHNEAWRYSDIAAVEAAWPLPAPESIIVPAGGTFARTIIQDSGSIHQLDIAIGRGAIVAQPVDPGQHDRRHHASRVGMGGRRGRGIPEGLVHHKDRSCDDNAEAGAQLEITSGGVQP